MESPVVRFEETTNIQRLVDADTYIIWKFQFEILLKSNGLLDLISEETTNENEKKDVVSDTKRDAQVQKIICQTIDKKHIPLIMSCKSARAMFEKLKFIFEKSSEQQKCNLLSEFYKYRFDTKNDVTSHISHLQNLSQKLNSLGENITDQMIISKILSSLPQKFNYFITAWESSPSSEKTLNNLTARLMTEEQRNNKEENVTTAYKAYNKKQCNICKKNNHLEKDCYYKNKQQCKICKKTNHKEKDCYFKNKDMKVNNNNNMRQNNNTRKSNYMTQSFLTYTEKK
ncbi:hypothetical protein ABMA27_003975 [Loxostege sticticalis]|uniref:Copia protein n=1 Tax=Loxostege sticticalis TaxID=481309 RepID=A0ABR3HR06_LOXSC